MRNYKLPKHIFSKVKKHETSLGSNDAFPPEEDYAFDYKILKKRFNEIVDNVKNVDGLESLNETVVMNKLGELMKQCREEERPIRPQLEELCINSVMNALNVPDGFIVLECNLVDKISPKKNQRITPEDSDNRKFDFADLGEFSSFGKEIMKRRFINSMIQGASYSLSRNYESFLPKLYEMNKKLPKLYDDIIALNDFLLFIKEENITDSNTMQGANVEVYLGHNDEMTEIYAQGLIFPYLLVETFRGFFELFASNGLPDDLKKAEYIISQSDFLKAEPWDLRLGVGIWKNIIDGIKGTRYIPYLFSELCSLEVDEFNAVMAEILAKTKKGKSIVFGMVSDYENDYEIQSLQNDIERRNSIKNVISDGYFTADELNDYVIEEEF